MLSYGIYASAIQTFEDEEENKKIQTASTAEEWGEKKSSTSYITWIVGALRECSYCHVGTNETEKGKVAAKRHIFPFSKNLNEKIIAF